MLSKCQVSPQRRVLDLESEVKYRPGLDTHMEKHFVTEYFCFQVVMPLMPILALLQFLSRLRL